MNEIILAYGLGILSISTGVLMRMILKAEKKVIEHQQLIDNLQREYERGVENLHRHIDDQRSITNRNFEDVHRKIDSRIDKLEFKMKDQSEYIRNKTSQAY
jgi:DNA-binding ferritin-like protein